MMMVVRSIYRFTRVPGTVITTCLLALTPHPTFIFSTETTQVASPPYSLKGGGDDQWQMAVAETTLRDS